MFNKRKTIWLDWRFSLPTAFWAILAIALFFCASGRSMTWCMIAGGLLGGAGHLVSLGRAHQSINPRIARGIILDPAYSALAGWLVCTIALYTDFGSVRVQFQDDHRFVAVFAFSGFVGFGADVIVDRLQARFVDSDA